ncbi:protein kinase domain-containing protein [Fimbriiglobus ruber]|uniref:Response regulator n=1 Tax=Fimbriiglobus ruber TaxID=1908690 RepID=A0A225DI31_9BACT|nr:HD domain-containing phosphohydrolase [Fimbriiglobus ruber]OWK39354.1 Response regulator [Fimbriiglobus ruber]
MFPVPSPPMNSDLNTNESDLAAAVLGKLLTTGAIPADAWDQVPLVGREALARQPNLHALADALLTRRLVTPYQAGRIRAGVVNGLVLGNYRILGKIGAGGMGTVFRAEHKKLKTPVAVKAMFADGAPGHRLGIERFFVEVRAVAALRHPNVVAAVDAGEEPHAGPDGENVPYLVMEYVPGKNLDDLVTNEGPLSIAVACQYAYQIADALTEAHGYGLVHRDIKPSNVLVTPDGRVKLLDFGVALLPNVDGRLTKDGARLGTVGYMSPEQARNPRDVDGRADVFGLAATMYFALTGRDPFMPPVGAAAATRPPSLIDARPDAPPALAVALDHMMALDPAARTETAAAAMRELAPFLGWSAATGPAPRIPSKINAPIPRDAIARPSSAGTDKSARGHRILIVDDEHAVRRVCRLALQPEPFTCDEVTNGPDAVAFGLAGGYDLILLDVDLPDLGGEEVLRKLRAHPPAPHLKIIMLSGRASGDDLSRLLSSGADDYLAKPFSVVQLRARVKAAIQLKEAQDRSDTLTRHLASANSELERALTARDGELIHARGALVLAMAKLVGQRSTETGPHLIRIQRYCRVLAAAAAATPAFDARLDTTFVQTVESAAPLHDIGKVAVPDHILNKPGKLTEEELEVMKAHTTIGAETLAEVCSRYPFATGFFHTAIEIARHHHERWDGTGYPDRLAGESIPLSARLVAIADVYDALRSRRVYKPAYSHQTAVEHMLDRSAGHFDPALVDVFRQVAPQFDRVFRDASD